MHYSGPGLSENDSAVTTDVCEDLMTGILVYIVEGILGFNVRLNRVWVISETGSDDWTASLAGPADGSRATVSADTTSLVIATDRLVAGRRDDRLPASGGTTSASVVGH